MNPKGNKRKEKDTEKSLITSKDRDSFRRKLIKKQTLNNKLKMNFPLPFPELHHEMLMGLVSERNPVRRDFIPLKLLTELGSA